MSVRPARYGGLVGAQLPLRNQPLDEVQGPVAREGRGVAVGAPQAVPQCKVLAVVVVKEEVVVGVVGGPVDELHQGPRHAVVPVVDGDGPDVDEDVQGQVEHLVEGEEEGVDVVGQPLEKAVYWVEGVAGKGRGHLPHVVRLVEQLSEEEVQLLVNVFYAGPWMLSCAGAIWTCKSPCK